LYEDILVECLRFSLSFSDHRISPLTEKYKPPRLSPFKLEPRKKVEKPKKS